MRINQFIAIQTGISRRKADKLVESGEVMIDGLRAKAGDQVDDTSDVTLYGNPLGKPLAQKQVIMLHKPVGYVCSRDGQGSKTVYDLLPARLHYLKPVGRLDKATSGLILLTNDGELANRLTHPRFVKEKQYEVQLDAPLTPSDTQKIARGVQLEDGLSSLALVGSGKSWTITMTEGRNRQIRRTFVKLGYRVTQLHRTVFGPYKLETLASGKYSKIVVK